MIRGLSDRPVRSTTVIPVTEAQPIASELVGCATPRRALVPLRPRGLVVPPDATEREERERVRAVLSRPASVAAVAAAVLPTAPPAPAAELGERTLERGDRGGDVRELQGTLTVVGLRTVANGLFGAGTTTSVRRYERQEDLA